MQQKTVFTLTELSPPGGMAADLHCDEHCSRGRAALWKPLEDTSSRSVQARDGSQKGDGWAEPSKIIGDFG